MPHLAESAAASHDASRRSHSPGEPAAQAAVAQNRRSA